jgi:hypothetical protein
MPRKKNFSQALKGGLSGRSRSHKISSVYCDFFKSHSVAFWPALLSIISREVRHQRSSLILLSRHTILGCLVPLSERSKSSPLGFGKHAFLQLSVHVA